MLFGTSTKIPKKKLLENLHMIKIQIRKIIRQDEGKKKKGSFFCVLWGEAGGEEEEEERLTCSQTLIPQ